MTDLYYFDDRFQVYSMDEAAALFKEDVEKGKRGQILSTDNNELVPSICIFYFFDKHQRFYCDYGFSDKASLFAIKFWGNLIKRFNNEYN